MPWWRRSKASDPLLDSMSAGAVALLEQLRAQVAELQAHMPDVVRVRKDATQATTEVSQLRALLLAEVARLDAAIVQVRGQATGGGRRKKGSSEEAEVGASVLAAVALAQQGDTSAFEQLIDQLQQAAGGADIEGPDAAAPRFS